MRNIRIDKLTFNFGSGKDQAKLDKGMMLIKHITGQDPVKTITSKRIPAWGLRPGLSVGCKLTLRHARARELIARLVQAKKSLLHRSQFDDNGSVAFGIPEYIDIPGVQYDPKIGIAGLQVCITLRRPGYRIRDRKLKKGRISKTHRITRDEAIEFMKNEFSIKVGE